MEIVQVFFSLFCNISILALMLFLALCALLYFSQNTIIYLPAFSGQPKSPNENMTGLKNPSERNLPYENIEIGTLDGQKLRGWLIKQEQSQNAPTVIFFHENAGNIGARLAFIQQYYEQVKCNILLIAYRGYSDSTGKPSEQGLMLDGESIINYLFHRSDINQNLIFVHGKSLGGAVAIHAVTQNVGSRVRGVILENTFTSIGDMVNVIFPKLKILKPLLLRNFWPSIEKINKISQSILFIYSMQDEIVPYSQMAQLESAASKAKSITKYIVEDGDHNSNWTKEPEKYFNAIYTFINDSINQ